MRPILDLARYSFGVWVSGVLVTGCGGGGVLPSPTPALSSAGPGVHGAAHSRARRARFTVDGYVYVSNRTEQGTSQLLVYRASAKAATPLRTITQKLVEVGGLAVDSSGDVYVANGSAGNVLEFAPGGTALLQAYSLGLYHPTDVAIADGTLYVADQGEAGNGYRQQVLEYAPGDGIPLTGIGGLGNLSQPNEGVAVDPLGFQGAFFVSTSSLTAIPPGGGCPGNDSVGESMMPTLWGVINLQQNRQAWGLAFDAAGNLYASDFCNNDVTVYSGGPSGFTFSHKVAGSFNAPLFLTVDDQFLAIPSAADAGSGFGYVTLIDLTGHSSAVHLSAGLEHPVGASFGPGSGF
jgi:DNA-binding beta-propeller fold protein YncE